MCLCIYPYDTMYICIMLCCGCVLGKIVTVNIIYNI